MTTTDPGRQSDPYTAHTQPNRPETDRVTTTDPHRPTGPYAAHTQPDRPGVTA